MNPSENSQQKESSNINKILQHGKQSQQKKQVRTSINEPKVQGQPKQTLIKQTKTLSTPKNQSLGAPIKPINQQKRNKLPVGGILSTGANLNQKQNTMKSTVLVDKTLSFGLRQLNQAILKEKIFEQRQIDKIVLNFKQYIKLQNQKIDLQTIVKKKTYTDAQGRQKEYNQLDLNEIQGMQIKQVNVITLFWVTLIQQVCQKIKIISPKICLQFIKFHIRMNKQTYLKQGKFNVKNFADPLLFPIINGKITLNKEHTKYTLILKEIQNIIQNVFRHYKLIFRQIAIRKQQYNQKYIRTFVHFIRNQDKQKQTIKNLIISLRLILLNFSGQRIEDNIDYFQSIIQSIWNLYRIFPQAFTIEYVQILINIIDENYQVFNQFYLKSYFKLYKNMRECLQKTLIQNLLSQKMLQDINKKTINIIQNYNCNIFQPFNFLINYNKIIQRNYKLQTNLYISGIHWKKFVDLLIQTLLKSNKIDKLLEKYIYDSILTILKQNSYQFWQNINQFQKFFQFTQYLYKNAEKSNDIIQLNNIFYKLLQIASSLMGKPADNNNQQQIILEYPQNKKCPFAIYTHNFFSKYFIQIQKQTYIQLIGYRLKLLIQQNSISDYTDAQTNFTKKQHQYIFKQYLFKLLISQPTLIQQICLKIKPQVSINKILNYLLIQTLKDVQSPKILVKSAFQMLDSFIVSEQYKSEIQKLLFLTNIFSKQQDQLVQQQFPQKYQNLIEYLFQLSHQYPYILQGFSNHALILIQNGYQKSKWCNLVLYNFTKIVSQKKYTNCMIYYARLLSNLFSRLNSKQSQYYYKLQKLKKYINFGFIIDFIKNCLKFDFKKEVHVNFLLTQKLHSKCQILIQGIRLFNIVLLYYLRKKPMKYGKYNSLTDKQSFQDEQQQQFFPFYLKKQLGINNKDSSSQVSSLCQQTTSYVNALSFIFLNSLKKQQNILKQINFNYQQLIFQCIQSLIKLNTKKSIKDIFIIFNANQAIIQSTFINKKGKNSYLNKFINYVQMTYNIIGVQILMFGNLIEDHFRLKKIVDNIRIKLQNPQLKKKLKYSKILDILSTLSRYFNNTINHIYLNFGNPSKTINLDQPQNKDHLQFLIQTIIKIIPEFFASNKIQEKLSLQNILINLYSGITLLQTFNRKYFVKWIKNIHRLILHRINLNYLQNQKQLNLNSKESYFKFQLSQEYFKILQLLLNSDQYMNQKQFRSLVEAQNFGQNLQNFIETIIIETQFFTLSNYLIDIILQIIISGLNLYSKITKIQQNLQTFFRKIYNVLRKSQEILKTHYNYAIIEILIRSQLNIRTKTNQIDLSIQFQALKVSLIHQKNVDLNILKQIIQTLKKPKLNQNFFVSLCNGILHLIKNSSQINWNQNNLIDDIFSVFKYFAGGFSQNKYKGQCPYKIIWIQEIILTLLTYVPYHQGIVPQFQMKIQQFLFQDEHFLARLGYFLKKIALYENEQNISWILGLQFEYSNNYAKYGVTYSEKLQLLALMKILNFTLANNTWNNIYSQIYINLIKGLLNFRKIFAHLPLSNKKPKAITQFEHQAILFNLNTFFSQQRGFVQLKMQHLNSNFNSNNFFQLLHQTINLQLLCQYSILLVTIPSNQNHSNILKKINILNEIGNWNQVNFLLIQSLKNKFTFYIQNKQILIKIYDNFTKNFYDSSILFASEQLYLNSNSLSTRINCQFDDIISLLRDSLCLLFDCTYSFLKIMQQKIQLQHVGQQSKFVNILRNLTKYDQGKIYFNYQLYDQNQQKTNFSRTIKSNITSRNIQQNRSQNLQNRSISPTRKVVRG